MGLFLAIISGVFCAYNMIRRNQIINEKVKYCDRFLNTSINLENDRKIKQLQEQNTVLTEKIASLEKEVQREKKENIELSNWLGHPNVM